MTRAKLAEFLRGLADSVASGDSMEGRVHYEISNRDGHDVDVDIAVRTGNLEGHGGYITVNEIARDADVDRGDST